MSSSTNRLSVYDINKIDSSTKSFYNDKVVFANLKDLRNISKECCDREYIKKYICDVCKLIIELITDYSNDNNKDVSDTLKYYLSGNEIGSNITSAGQTSSDKLFEVIKEGNLREQMTIIMNFAMRGCKVILWAICNNSKLIKQEKINELKTRLYHLTGLKDINVIQEYVLDCETCVLPCSFVSLSKDGSVTTSRMTSFPMLNILREKRINNNNNNYKVKISDVYPPLSKRELNYMNLISLADHYLPWITGFRYWQVNNENFYIKLMKEYNQLIVSGPSGNTDLQLSVLSLFNNFNIDYSVISCVAWMCNPPDHSPCEILLAAIPYGLDDWGIADNLNAFEYIKNKLKKLDTNMIHKIGKEVKGIGGKKSKKQPKKEILGKMICIYKMPGDHKEYVKHKGELITVKDYKKLIKLKKTKETKKAKQVY